MISLPIAQSKELVLDGTKIRWYKDRVDAWERGERVAPINVDIAATRSCNFRCNFCYSMLQGNGDKEYPITEKVLIDFLDDAKEIGVKGISFVSDGESTINPAFYPAVQHGHEIGLTMAVGSNGLLLNKKRMEKLLHAFQGGYVRINFSAGTEEGYCRIMGVKSEWYWQVQQNIKDMVEIKRRQGLDVTIGMQAVISPDMNDEILPLTKLGKELRPDYLVLKHTSDDENGSLGIDYSRYSEIEDNLRRAEELSDDSYKVVVKWDKIKRGNNRPYKRCYGTPFLLQISGSGLVAPCGMVFNDLYSRYHIGNICEKRFRDIWASDEYWEVINHLASPNFNAQCNCGSLCLQDYVNVALDNHVKGIKRIESMPEGAIPPKHLSFV